MLKFDISEQDVKSIASVVKRAKLIKSDINNRLLTMDLIVCHNNGCKLNFDLLLQFDDLDFTHDIDGIQKYINRDNGLLTDCFQPRCVLV